MEVQKPQCQLAAEDDWSINTHFLTKKCYFSASTKTLRWKWAVTVVKRENPKFWYPFFGRFSEMNSRFATKTCFYEHSFRSAGTFMYIYIHISIYMHVYIRTCIHTYIYMYNIYICTWLFKYVSMYVYLMCIWSQKSGTYERGLSSSSYAWDHQSGCTSHESEVLSDGPWLVSPPKRKCYGRWFSFLDNGHWHFSMLSLSRSVVLLFFFGNHPWLTGFWGVIKGGLGRWVHWFPTSEGKTWDTQIWGTRPGKLTKNYGKSPFYSWEHPLQMAINGHFQ